MAHAPSSAFLVKVLMVFVTFMICALVLLNDLAEIQSVHTETYDAGVASNVLPITLSIKQERKVSVVSRVNGDVIIKADFDAPKIHEEDITVLIKTMDRPKCLNNLVSRIREQHPTIPIIIADDGHLDSLSAVSSIRDVMFFRMPYDSGLSSGRNLMLSQVVTMYVLLLDDDFLWDSNILTHFRHVMQLHPHLDLVGGRAGLDFAGLMHTVDDTLFLVKGNRGILEGTALPILTPRDPAVNYPEPNFSDMGPPCVLVDFVPNFFLARTDSLLKLQWDNNLKVGEHEEFFLRFNSGKFRVAYCTALYVENQQDKCNNIEDEVAGKLRRQNRARARAFIKKGLYMHNISKLAYCLGDGFASFSWNVVHSPVSSEICHEVPLPESCPVGRMGIKCDRCAPGFTGSKCDQCLPNHFGLQCVPCQCEHGSCEVYEDGNDHLVMCKCDANWFGATCDKHLILGSNLILDPNFSSLRSTEPAVGLWRLYKDGCARWADNGVWLMNDGFMHCGAYYVVELHQKEPLIIVISAESKGVGIAPFKDPAQYSIYLDIAYGDGNFLYGQVISFPEGTHVMQYKELVLPLNKSVSKITVYVMLQVLTGNAFFQSVSVREQIK